MVWLEERQIANIAVGASVLASGGGGDTQTGACMALAAVRRCGSVRLLAPFELADDALVVPVAFMGSPRVQAEKIPGVQTLGSPIRLLEEVLGRRADAVAAMEVGGGNSLIALAMAASCGLPLVDGDGLGRAFPELQMMTLAIYGNAGSPTVAVNERGDHVTLWARDNLTLERLARGVAQQFGGCAYIAGFASPGHRFKEGAVLYSVSLAERLGAAMRHAKGQLDETLSALSDVLGNSTYGRPVVLADGLVSALTHSRGEGWGRGQFTLEQSGRRQTHVAFQNEFLFASADDRPLCMVPDILVAIEADSARPLSVDEISYGQRIVLLGVPVPEILRTPVALHTVGPRAFGFDCEYTPLDSLEFVKGEAGGRAVHSGR